MIFRKDREDGAGKGRKSGTEKRTEGDRRGFVLVYGGVEENCSAGALFASQRDELADKVHAMLFG